MSLLVKQCFDVGLSAAVWPHSPCQFTTPPLHVMGFGVDLGAATGTNRNHGPHIPFRLLYTPYVYLAPFWRNAHLLQMDGLAPLS